MGGGSAPTAGGDGSSAKATEGVARKVIEAPTARERDTRRDRACTAESTLRQQQQQRGGIRCEYIVC